MRSCEFKTLPPMRAALVAAGVASLAVLAGCNASQTLSPSETLTQGYVMDEQALELVPVGSSREQVLLALGTPSTTSTFENDKAFHANVYRYLIDQARLDRLADALVTVSAME